MLSRSACPTVLEFGMVMMKATSPSSRKGAAASCARLAASGPSPVAISTVFLLECWLTLSIVDRLGLCRLGRSADPLQPYEGLVRSSSGHKLRIHGWISLPVRLGSMEATLNLLVADGLDVDAILGVDALGAFDAVIDVSERVMTLKCSGEKLSLGVIVVHETFMASMTPSIRLSPAG
jgi:hypothetical protein